MTVVAKIDRDHLAEQDMEGINHKGKKFDYEAMENWWGWGHIWWGTGDDGLPSIEELAGNGHTRFKLYDDDGELYYEGWLFTDPGCFVQQFVLRWAESDSGCTVIKIEKDGKWVQEIG